MNENGHPETLRASQPGNTNAGRYGVYSKRMREPLAQARAEWLAGQGALEPDHPLFDVIVSQYAFLDALDADIQSNGVCDKNGKPRTVVDLRNRAMSGLQRLLESAGMTPASAAQLRKASAEIELGAELRDATPRNDRFSYFGPHLEAALEKLAFSDNPSLTPADRMRAFRLLLELREKERPD